MNKTKVWTPNGYQVGPINSLVGKGESIIDYTNGTGTLVTKGKVGVDNQPSSVKESDSNVIAGNDVDWTTGIKFSDQIAPLTAKLQMYNNIEKATGKNHNMSSLSKQTVQLQKQQIDKAKAPLLSQMKNITDRQQIQHDIQGSVENMKKYDSGKSSSYFYSRTGNGKVPNSWLTSARLIPALTETAMLNHWLSNKPKGTNIYSQNTYAPLALQTLASSRISPYPMIQAAKLADRQGMYSINQSGGYTGAQRQNARIAQNLGTQRNIANILQNVEEKNMGYRNAWAQAALQAGESDAARRQSAKQYNWETYNRAHGAKTKGIETHVANLGAMWQKYWADRIKNKQYEDTLSLYQQDVDNRKLALKGLLEGNKNTPLTSDKSTNTTQLKNKFGPMNLHYGNYAITRLGEPGSILWRNYQKIMNDHDNVLKNAYLREAYDKQMYGDNGGGFMNFKIGDQFSIPTNKTYLNAYTPYEWIAGTDDMEMMAKKPSTYSGVFPYGMDVNKLINSVNNLRYK